MIDNRNLACEGWKSPSLTLATLAKPGGNGKITARRRPAPAELRQPTTMWQLLIWAYQRQKAHLGEADVPAGNRPGLSPTAVVVQRLLLGASIDGGGHGFGLSGGAGRACDADALEVHGCVVSLGKHARRLIETASVGQEPDFPAGAGLGPCGA
jgi:hypothetical protein